jgi:CheY-like chemotaxis protein
MKILLAEDDDICQMPIKTFSKKLGLELDVACDGKEAVDFAKSNNYDLILMDLNMPTMSGYEATEAIRNLPNGSQFKILALSGGMLYFNIFRRH